MKDKKVEQVMHFAQPFLIRQHYFATYLSTLFRQLIKPVLRFCYLK
ncbi:hypothetical protein [Alkalihalobacillus deserti]|nr:hypothetical protein [Alkalihalobacillus deserti]